MVSIFIRTILVYILLNVVLNIMGKRQIGELEVGELVCTLLISEIAAIPISDPDIPLLWAVVPIIFICAIEVALSAIKNRCTKVKRAVEGNSLYIIYKGRLRQNVLLENRISINEVLTEIRIQGFGGIGDVEYGILEQNGKISLFDKNTTLSHFLVIDGEVNKNAMRELGYNEGWLNRVLSEEKLSLGEVFLLSVDDDGKRNIVKKEVEK